MPPAHTDAQFDQLSWHDCLIWRVDFQVGDTDEDDWTSDLVFGLDFITEWLCGTDRQVRFRVAPAWLTFHGVTDPTIAVDWGDTGHQTALNLMSSLCKDFWPQNMGMTLS